MDDKQKGVRRRTEMFLKNERGKPHEFDRLHAVLCLTHGWANNEEDLQASIALRDIVDTELIAERCDELLMKGRSHG